MFIKSFLYPGFLYLCGLGIFILSSKSAYDIGGICLIEIGNSSPLYGMVASLHWLLFSFFAARIDPGYVKIRSSWFFTGLFFYLFFLVIGLCFAFVIPNLDLLFC